MEADIPVPAEVALQAHTTPKSYGIAALIAVKLQASNDLPEELRLCLKNAACADAKRWRDASELPISAARDEMAALAEAAETLAKHLQ